MPQSEPQPDPTRPPGLDEALAKMDLPPSPLTAGDELAAQVRESYELFKKHEFTDRQALYLTVAFIMSSPGPAPGQL